MAINMEKDYQKEAWQLHIAFHREVLDGLDEYLRAGPFSELEIENIKKIVEDGHNLFDTLVLWIEWMQKENYRLQGKVEQAEKMALLLKPEVRRSNEG